MNKTVVVICFLMAFSFQSPAQKLYSNYVKLHSSGFAVPGKDVGPNLFNQLGVSGGRRVYKNLYVSAGYHYWKTWAQESFMKKMGYGYSDKPVINSDSIVTSAYTKSRMIDLSVEYKYQLASRHVFTGGLGASYCRGRKDYEIFYRGTCMFRSETEDVSFWGVVPQLSYDYLMLNGHMSLGADVRARYYTGRPTGQYDYGVHMGVGF